jgi:hypothetical protein
MRNNTLQRGVRVLGFTFAMALMPSAQAVQITLNLPDCPSGQALAFNPQTNALACTGSVQVNTPGGCSVTAAPTSSLQNPIAASTSVTLTALCTTGTTPITYAWSLGGSTDVINVAPTATTTFSVTAHNDAGFGTPFSSTVYIIGSVVAPGNCSIAQSPNTNVNAVSAGSTVNLTATCSTGNAPTSCAWSGGIASTSCSSVAVTAPATTTGYSVVASNSAGPAPSVSTTVNVQSTTSTGTNLCTGSDQIVNVGWPSTEQAQVQTRGLTQNNIAFRLTIPSSFNPSLNPAHTGYISMVEVPGALRTAREISVSKNSCDFSTANSMLTAAGGTAPAFSFAVNNPTGYRTIGGSLNIQAGDVVYVNVRNQYHGASTCPIGKNCDVLFNYKTPNSY